MEFLRRPSTAGALATLLVVSGPFEAVRALEGSPEMSQRAPELKAATLPVEGMVCLSCAASIKRAVRKVDGVADAEIDFVGRALRVTYEPGRPLLLNRVRIAIDGLGYKAGTPVVAP